MRFAPFLLASTAVAGLLSSVLAAPARAQFEVVQEGDGVTVNCDGRLVTRYLTKSGAKPVFWPVIGPHGDPVTRAYPLGEGQDERQDHIHQRSFWFTHGDVNGVDFWSEMPGHGEIVHKEFVTLSGGPQATIVTRNDWVGPDGQRICEDERSFIIGRGESGLYFDCSLTVTAVAPTVKFGDTKEGAFGVRVAESMKVEAGQGGEIVNSEGQKNEAAWGQPAAWVDYSGPVNGKTVGIAILNHPSSFRYPTYWHVRTYGLFAANPFGLHHFQGNNAVDGSHTMAKGESFALRYRVLIHPGDAAAAGVARVFQAYSQEKAER